MKTGAFLAGARALPLTELPPLTRGAALVLAPHPDDESLGCGGLIAEACRRGEPPLVVVLTDGAASHPNSKAYPPARLRAAREDETRAAVACLGLDPKRLVFLRLRDTQVPTQGPEQAEIVSRLTGLVQVHGCRSLIAPWEHDPHGDHAAAHLIAVQVAQQTEISHWAYPVWGLTLPDDAELPLGPTGVRLDISRHRVAKRRAILAHQTQHAGIVDDDPGGFQMKQEFMALFDTDHEIYLDAA